MDNKKNVLLIFGGASPEYDVSCSSAAGIIENIDYNSYNLFVVGITRQGDWIYTKASAEDIRETNKWIESKTNKKAILSVDRSTHGLVIFNDDGSTINEYIDVIFPIIHGENGEDGTLQGLFEIAGIPYVGANVCASACSMDKVVTRLFADYIGILQPKCYILDSDEINDDKKDIVERVEKCIGDSYPMIVKPSMTGSSVGISKVNNPDELYDAILFASQYKGKIMIEEYITGKEIKVAVLEKNEAITTGELCEIVVADGCFNDYNLKYKATGTHKKIPADIKKEVADEIKEISIKIFKELNCKDYSRVDFFLTNDDKIYFNEINTIPGFSKKSIYPLMIDKIGMDYTQLISSLINNNVDR